jgi:monofunctional biosynthetic peptidoglycan transglycosylase
VRVARKAGVWSAGAAAIGFACLAYLYVTVPDVRSLASSNPETTAFMELRDREARANGKEPRRVHKWVNYNRISPHLKKAVLVAEDAAFWQHDGVDYVELQKSLELDWARGQLLRGASTITQQLAKNLYLSPSRNPLRKLRELIIARRLEAELQKARILELYLNLIEWGDGIWGIESAARTYFGTAAAALGPTESALLAGAIINPRVLNPSHPTARLLRRQQIILGRMGGVVPPTETASEKPPADAEAASETGAPTPRVPPAAEPGEGRATGTPEPGEGRPDGTKPVPDAPKPDPLDARPLPFPGENR